MATDREQLLVDLCFAIGLTISNKDAELYKLSQNKKAEWIASKLKDCGFDTVRMGSSWGVLK